MGFIWELNRGFEGFGDFFEDFSKVFDVKTLKEKSAEIRFEVFDQKHALEIFSNIKITSRSLFDPLPVPIPY